MKEILGKTVKAFRGFKIKKFGKDIVTLRYILFDDEETFLTLSKQDPYDYHDCCDDARVIDVTQDDKEWKKVFALEETTGDE